MRTFSDSDRTTSSDASRSDSEFSVISAFEALGLSDNSQAVSRGSSRRSGGRSHTSSRPTGSERATSIRELGELLDDMDEYEIILMSPSTVGRSDLMSAPSSESSETASSAGSDVTASTPTASGRSRPAGSKARSRARRRKETETDESDLDTSDVETTGATTGGSTDPPSLVTTLSKPMKLCDSASTISEAQQSINTFFTDTDHFTSDKANKLRLWQALCIEFGLVELVGSVPPSLPDLPSSELSSGSSTASDTSRSSTPRPTLPSLPASLTQARLLLKNHGHVNIVEYIDARNDPARHTKVGTDTVGKYADLVYSSKSSLMRATQKGRKFYPLDATKREWLEPLLKDFGIRRRRASATVDY